MHGQYNIVQPPSKTWHICLSQSCTVTPLQHCRNGCEHPARARMFTHLCNIHLDLCFIDFQALGVLAIQSYALYSTPLHEQLGAGQRPFRYHEQPDLQTMTLILSRHLESIRLGPPPDELCGLTEAARPMPFSSPPVYPYYKK